MYKLKIGTSTVGELDINKVCVYRYVYMNSNLPILKFIDDESTVTSTLEFLKWLMHKENVSDADIIIEMLTHTGELERDGIKLE